MIGGQAPDRRGHGQADHQHETLGDEADHPGDGRYEAIVGASVGSKLAPQEQGREGNEHPADEPQHTVDAIAQLGVGRRIRASLRHQLLDPRIDPDAGHEYQRRASDHGTSGEDLVVDLLGHRVGFTGQGRFVGLQSVCVDDSPVCGQLVADPESNDVVSHNLGSVDHDFDALSNDGDGRSHLHPQSIQRSFGGEFLNDSDRRIEYQNDAEQRVYWTPNDQYCQRQNADDGVEPS